MYAQAQYYKGLTLAGFGNVVRAVKNEHDTFSTLLSEIGCDELRRWQKFLVIITLVVVGLMVCIWMYSSKA